MIDTIVDTYYRAQPDFKAMRQAGVVAVIHKATEGSDWIDPEYHSRRELAKQAGLLWGSYHYSSGISVTDQVENYVTHASPTKDELICIDYERSSSGPDMSLEQLERFVVLIEERLNRVPMVYGGDLLRQVTGLNPSATLERCPLWYSRYRSEPIGIPPGIWKSWTLWQYTDGASGPEPHVVPGLGRADRSRYEGTEADLRRNWPFTVAHVDVPGASRPPPGTPRQPATAKRTARGSSRPRAKAK